MKFTSYQMYKIEFEPIEIKSLRKFMQFAWDHSNIGENISFAGRILELTVDKKEIHGFSWTANESEVERLFMVLDDVRNDYEAPVGIQEFGDKLIQDLSS